MKDSPNHTAKTAYANGDYESAFQLWSQQALAGDPQAKYRIGLMYEHGEGVVSNFRVALEWYASAANDGEPEALHNLAWIYISGDAGEENQVEGYRLLRKNAENGFAASQSDLGHLLLRGDIVSDDRNEAIHFLSSAAEQGIPGAQNTIGAMHLEGKEVVKDSTRALHFFQQAANQGDSVGIFNLAGLYLQGESVPKDVSKGVSLLEKAAEAGMVQAQVNLGALYYNNSEVPRKYKAAFYWYSMAAQQGDPIGQHNLGLMYARGHGAAADFGESAYWLTLSLRGGYEASESALEEIKSQLSREKIKLLQKKLGDNPQQVSADREHIQLWREQAMDFDIANPAQKGLLFLCGALGSVGENKEAITARLNWLVPIGAHTDLEVECGGIYDSQIGSLLEEVLFYLGAKIQFRELNPGGTSIRALVPQNHELMAIKESFEHSMFAIHEVYSEFFIQLGEILERSNFDERHCYLAGIFYFQNNCRVDVHGFIETFRFLEGFLSPVYRYLMDIPAIGNVEHLRGLLPFQRVFHGFVAGMSSNTIGRLWSLQSFLLFKTDRSADVQAQYLDVDALIERTADSVREHMRKHPDVLTSLHLEDMLPQRDLILPRGVRLSSHVINVVRQRWGGDLSADESSNNGRMLMYNVCIFYTAAAVILANSE